MSNLLGAGRTEEGRGGQPTQIFMSLFLILLCFFVLLVGHSANRQDMSQIALGSVKQAFGGASREYPPGPRPLETPDGVSVIVEDLRTGIIESAGAASLVEGGGEAVLRFALARNRLFDRDDTLLQASEGVRHAAAQAIMREADGFALELEISVERAPDTAERDAIALDRIARDLVRRGIPPHRVSISLEAGIGPDPRFSFFARPVLPPDMALAAPGPRS